jgi:hypothetical protein
MTTATSPAPEDRINKRLKQADDGSAAPGPQPMLPQQQQLDQQQAKQQRYPPPAPLPPANQQQYGVGMPPNIPPPSHMPPGGYYGAPPPPPMPPHYGNHGPPPPPPPPHHWQGGGPSWQHHSGYRDSTTPKGLKSKSKRERGDEAYHYPHGPPPGYQGPPPGYGPPPHWHSNAAPLPPPMYASQGTWTGKSPPRSGGSRHRDPYRHEMELPPYMTHGQESVDDDGASSTGESNREKGRGSYKCGRVRILLFLDPYHCVVLNCFAADAYHCLSLI